MQGSRVIRASKAVRGDPGTVAMTAWCISGLRGGTEHLPLHVHESSDQLVVVSSRLGVFHCLPDPGRSRELRSAVADAGDIVLFTRGAVHRFTAPVGPLTLLSYHAPFFEFDDARQSTILRRAEGAQCEWSPAQLHQARDVVANP